MGKTCTAVLKVSFLVSVADRCLKWPAFLALSYIYINKYA